jgi:hypothetical protein
MGGVSRGVEWRRYQWSERVKEARPNVQNGGRKVGVPAKWVEDVTLWITKLRCGMYSSNRFSFYRCCLDGGLALFLFTRLRGRGWRWTRAVLPYAGTLALTS